MTDDISKVDGDPVKMARYHANHRELVSLNDWTVARRTISGQSIRQFLMKSAYWWCCSKDLTIVDFAAECEISVSTAVTFDKKMRSIYPETAGLELGKYGKPADKPQLSKFVLKALKKMELNK